MEGFQPPLQINGSNWFLWSLLILGHFAYFCLFDRSFGFWVGIDFPPVCNLVSVSSDVNSQPPLGHFAGDFGSDICQECVLYSSSLFLLFSCFSFWSYFLFPIWHYFIVFPCTESWNLVCEA